MNPRKKRRKKLPATRSSRRRAGGSAKDQAPHPGPARDSGPDEARNPDNERVAATHQRIKAVLDSGLNPRVLFRAVRDTDGRITDFLFAEANDEACAYNSLSREELLGRRLLELFPNSRDAGLFARYVAALESGETLELKDFSYAHDLKGEKRFFDIRAVPTGDELAYTWRDVTDRPRGDKAAGTPWPRALERRRKRGKDSDAENQIREFQALAQNLLRLREQEQQVISRELHDNIAQVLSAVSTRISLARRETIPAWLRQELEDLRGNLRSALADVRTLARELRPSVLDHLGFAAALEKHAQAFRERTRMTLDVALVPEDISFLDHGDLTHLFRLTQEALQNTEDHSGAQRAWVKLCRCDGTLQLEIGDDGRAFTPDRVVEAQRDGHLGLLGMRERAELLGGHFQLEAVPGQGTVIRVSVPPPGSAPEFQP